MNEDYPNPNTGWFYAASAARLLGYKWAIPIVYVLNENGEMRYNELIREMQITPKMLSDTMTVLINSGVVEHDTTGEYDVYRVRVDPNDVLESLEEFNEERVE